MSVRIETGRREPRGDGGWEKEVRVRFPAIRAATFKYRLVASPVGSGRSRYWFVSLFDGGCCMGTAVVPALASIRKVLRCLGAIE